MRGKHTANLSIGIINEYAHTDILDLSSVDFNNIDAVIDYAVRLMNAGNSLGVLCGDKPLQTREAKAIYNAAKGWVNAVKPPDAYDASIKIVASYRCL